MKVKKRCQTLTVPEKANRLLTGILVFLAIIAFRLWHLAVIEHDRKLEEAYKPQKRIIPELVERATICDRFGKILAENQMQYDVSVSYSAIRDIPIRAWHTDADGVKKRISVRKQYIGRLAELLAQELHLDKDMIEDQIHAKASILGSVPYLIQADVSERTFLKLQMLAKDWPGLHVSASVRRYYPEGRVCSDILGYVGPISANEYKKITQELSILRECIRAYGEGEDPKLPHGFSSIDEVRALLQKLESQAYHLNALVGKIGIEASYDGKLRGRIGKKTILVDRRGNFIQEMDDVEPMAHGKKLRLTISAELQAFADSLLLEHEKTEQIRNPWKQTDRLPPFFPWIKGGAIIALDPKNGQILAMSSSPRFHNNDFINMKLATNQEEIRSSVYRWLENVEHIEEIYDRKVPLRRERIASNTGEAYEEELSLSFEVFLDFILPNTSQVKQVMKQYASLGEAVYIQRCVHRLLQFFRYDEGLYSCAAIFDMVYPKHECHMPTGEILSLKQKRLLEECFLSHEEAIQKLKKELDVFFSSLPANYDKMLLVDLYQLVIDPQKIDAELLEKVHDMTLFEFTDCQGHYIALKDAFSKIIEEVFYEIDFKQWRDTHGTKFLDQKRKEELQRKQKYPTPYVDYLFKEQRKQYRQFCAQYLDHFLNFLLFENEEVYSELHAYYEVLSAWKNELNHGAHKACAWYRHYLFFKSGISSEIINHGSELCCVFRGFADLQRPLFGKYPLMLTKNQPQLEQDLAAAFYPTYGFGYLRPHSFGQAATLGSIFKLVSAYSVLTQKVDDVEIDDLSKVFVMFDKQTPGFSYRKPHVGFFQDGTPIPLFFKGGSLLGNSFSGRGCIDLISALEMSSNPYFSLLVGEHLADPEDLYHAASLFGFGEKTGVHLAGEYAGRVPQDLSYNRSGLYATAIGQHTLVVTPLQTAMMMASLVNGGELYIPSLVLGEESDHQITLYPAEKKRTIYLPSSIEKVFKDGMKQVIWGKFGTTRSLRDKFSPEMLSRVIGKTSTAESIVRVGLDREFGTLKMKHVWFGSVGFADAELKDPEIVVIVYLRLGEFGRDAAPMAIRMIEMWEKIKQKESFLEHS